MVGPVLYQEMLLGSRRTRLHVFRWCYAGWLLAQLGFLWLSHVLLVFAFTWGRGRMGYADIAEFARNYIEVFVVQHFILLTLVTPAFTAGSITDEKWRGTLQYLLISFLRPWEILVGKLIARSYQVILLALTGLPLLCFIGVLGGLDFGMLLSVCAYSLLLIFAVGSASLLASVVCRHTRDAVLSLYVVGAALYLLARLLHYWISSLAAAAPAGTASAAAPGWVRWLASVLDCFNPIYPMGHNWTLETPAERGRRLLAALAAWGLLGGACLLLAVVRLRRDYLRYLQASGRKKLRWWQARRPAVPQEQPVRWKERHVEGVAPLAVLREYPRWLGLLLVVLATFLWSGWIILSHLPVGLGHIWHLLVALDFAELLQALTGGTPAAREFFNQGLAVMLLAALVIGVRCSGAVTGEREKNTWEALLLTPMETHQLIRSKLWGIIGASVPYLIAYAATALPLALLGGGGAVLWILLWLGVTVLAMGYAGAAGLWCSVRSKTSWRSLLGTLAFTYLGGFVIYLVGSCPASILALLITLIIALLDPSWGGRGMAPRVFTMTGEVFSVAICIILAGAFVLAAWLLLRQAEYRVGVLERTKHWKYEPPSPRPYRPRRPLRYDA